MKPVATALTTPTILLILFMVPEWFLQHVGLWSLD